MYAGPIFWLTVLVVIGHSDVVARVRRYKPRRVPYRPIVDRTRDTRMPWFGNMLPGDTRGVSSPIDGFIPKSHSRITSKEWSPIDGLISNSHSRMIIPRTGPVKGRNPFSLFDVNPIVDSRRSRNKSNKIPSRMRSRIQSPSRSSFSSLELSRILNIMRSGQNPIRSEPSPIGCRFPNSIGSTRRSICACRCHSPFRSSIRSLDRSRNRSPVRSRSRKPVKFTVRSSSDIRRSPSTVRPTSQETDAVVGLDRQFKSRNPVRSTERSSSDVRRIPSTTRPTTPENNTLEGLDRLFTHRVRIIKLSFTRPKKQRSR